MKTASTNKKVREIVNMVREGKLIPRPEFQRRLVWSREDKNNFLDSVINGYPFPEIYLADGMVDLQTGEGTQLLVDGQQRVATMVQYFEGDPDLKLTTVPSYQSLTVDQKREYLQYDVAVRDLGSITKEQIIEVFKRLNATKHALHDIEVNNAVYGGQLKRFCETVAQSPFFESHGVFSAQDYKRMGDLRFALSLIGTMIEGYFNRDDMFEELLAIYNDDFPQQEEIAQRVAIVFQFIEECGFSEKSRVWKKADLFTLFCELDFAFNRAGLKLEPFYVVHRLEDFYNAVSSGELRSPAQDLYYKAALQASNDRINRMRRGMIIQHLISGASEETTVVALLQNRLV